MSQFNGFTERRERAQPDYIHKSNLLKPQKPAIKQLEKKGYVLWFVRTMTKDCVLAVLHHKDNKDNIIAVYHDGEIDYAPKLKLRQ